MTGLSTASKVKPLGVFVPHTKIKLYCNSMMIAPFPVLLPISFRLSVWLLRMRGICRNVGGATLIAMETTVFIYTCIARMRVFSANL